MPTNDETISAESRRVASRLREVAFTSRKRLDMLDLRRARAADALAGQLDRLAWIIDQWPRVPDANVALVRGPTIATLIARLKEALDMLEAMPSYGALGPVRRSSG